LALVLALAFGLRVGGITAGLPQSYVADEYDFVHGQLGMMKTGNLNPRTWYHPTLQPYLALATYSTVFLLEVPRGRWARVQEVTEEDMLYWGRFVGVMAGAAAVLVTFLLGRRLFGTMVGLLAAALMAVFPGAVQHSQYNKPDPVLALMTAVSVLVILVYLERGGRGLALGCGVVMGLTLAAKYNGVVVGLGLVLYRVNAARAVFLSFPVLYYGYYSLQRINYRPNLIPVYPFLAVLAAYAVAELLGWLGRRPLGQRRAVVPLTAAVLLVLLLVPPLVTAVRYDVENTRRDTGSYAREWIDRTFPPGTHLALERHTPVLDRSRYKI